MTEKKGWLPVLKILAPMAVSGIGAIVGYSSYSNYNGPYTFELQLFFGISVAIIFGIFAHFAVGDLIGS
jgi:hypothetical protein